MPAPAPLALIIPSMPVAAPPAPALGVFRLLGLPAQRSIRRDLERFALGDRSLVLGDAVADFQEVDLLDDGRVPVLGVLVDLGHDLQSGPLDPEPFLGRPDLAQFGQLVDVEIRRGEAVPPWAGRRRRRSRLGIEGVEGLVNLFDMLGIGLDVVDLGELDGTVRDFLGPFPAPFAKPLLNGLGPFEQRRLPAVEPLPGRVDVLGQDLGLLLDDGLVLVVGDVWWRNGFTSLSAWVMVLVFESARACTGPDPGSRR